ncbi:alpha/beta fold hydrolase [Nocardioides sp. GCM10027113]|uniref:alpha/beta fold hydrolase n=1 Tax=unclassified Nocardioides TaxID=2615069 RepID=UPI0036177B16
MSARRRIAGVAAGAVGVAVAGTAVGVVAHRRRVIARRGAGDTTPFGELRSEPFTVIADDGVPLHVEIDEYAAPSGRRRARSVDGTALTLVFVHGFALNMDCWHFQRAGYRGLVRAVYYDQRSHGRSGRSSAQNATIDQLGRDLARVLEEAVPEGPVVLIGHSMGGMTIFALAEQHPELFGDRIVGVGLVATTAGGLDPHRIVVPLMPSGLGRQLAMRLMATLARGHRTVDSLRRAGRAIASVFTDMFAFGDDVPASYVDFADEMLSATPFEVLAEFFPDFGLMDKFDTVHTIGRVPTAIICGTADKMTSVGHSRKLHSRIEGSTLVECEGAGHLVIMERHDQVNAALDQLIAAAAEGVHSQ